MSIPKEVGALRSAGIGVRTDNWRTDVGQIKLAQRAENPQSLNLKQTEDALNKTSAQLELIAMKQV